MKYFLSLFLFICIATVSFLGFRGSISLKTPIYVFPDMDYQARYKPQGQNDFFEDKRNDRPVVPGTIVRGYGWERQGVFSNEYTYKRVGRESLYTGKDARGEWITDFPLEVNYTLLEQGHAKYAIFCTPCHGLAGDGNGITKQYGMIATPSYHDTRLRTMANGEFFNTITHGKGLMGGYAGQLNPEERWAVIAYVRALQKSQNATLADVPQQHLSELGL